MASKQITENTVVVMHENDVKVGQFDHLSTKSAKIRAMHQSGMTRGEIAKKLNIRYQHVRNVLITPVKKG